MKMNISRMRAYALAYLFQIVSCSSSGSNSQPMSWATTTQTSFLLPAHNAQQQRALGSKRPEAHERLSVVEGRAKSGRLSWKAIWDYLSRIDPLNYQSSLNFNVLLLKESKVAVGVVWSGGVVILVILATIVMIITVVGDFCPAVWCLQGVYAIALLAALNQVAMQSFVHHGSVLLSLEFSVLFLARCIFCAVLGIAYAKLGPTKIDLWPATRELQMKVCFRGVLGSTNVLSFFAALTFAPVPLVLAIYLSAPWIAAFLSWIILNEKLAWQKFLLMIVGFCAVLVMIYGMQADGTKTSPGANLVLGSVFAAVSAVAMATSGVAMQSVAGQVHHITLVVALGMTGLIFCIPLIIIFPQHFAGLVGNDSFTQIFVLVSVGLTSFLLQVALNKAYLLKEQPAPIMLFINAISLALQFVVDVTVGYRYSWLAWVGCIVMLLYFGASFWIDHYLKRQGDPTGKSKTSDS